MYLQNKYTRIYNNIVEQANSRTITGYTETHHILPKSLGGSNNKDNLVVLTAREHFICHRLLTKMTQGTAKKKMHYAVVMMLVQNQNQQRNFKITSRTYEIIRKECNKSMKGYKHTEETKEKLKQSWTDERKKTFSKMYKGRRFGGSKPGVKRPNLTGEKNGFFGKKHDPAFLERKRQSLLGVNPFAGKDKICPHCNRSMNPGNYKQFHGDNCKLSF